MSLLGVLTLAQVALPFVASCVLFLGHFRRESSVTWLAAAVAAANSLLWGAVFWGWAQGGFLPIDLPFGTLFEYGDYHFDLSFQVDTLTLVFSGLTAFITGSVIKYSQYYMHREPGYARFFVNIFIFLGGINLLSLAGTLDLLFAGWEVVGISSFLLIAFYRERLQPSRHALRTYTVYRFCDTGLLLGAWLSHLVWHASPTFSDLGSDALLLVLRQAGEWPLLGLSLLVLLAACGKSAQFPFTFWIPRAMEGPTPSSAIFYGALSIHAGVFLLLRMSPVWESSEWAPYAIGFIGTITAIVSTLIGHAQSNIKGQIAYASSAQVGLMFVELALGWESFAMFHMVGNALLRCFQLLVSPSILAFVLRRQGEGGGGIRLLGVSLEKFIPERWRISLYVFSLNEGYLEAGCRTFLWQPIRLVGKAVERLAMRPKRAFPLVALMGIGVSVAAGGTRDLGAGLLVAVAFALACYSVSTFRRPIRAWDAATIAGIAMAAAISFADHEALMGGVLVLVGNVFGWSLGRVALARFERRQPGLDLSEYHGMVKVDPRGCWLLFLGFLLVAGFPIGPGFLGEDLLLHSSIRVGQWSTALLGLIFVLNGLGLARVFVRMSFAGFHRTPLRWNFEGSETAIRHRL